MRQELTELGQMFFLNLLLRRPTVVSFFTVEVISTWFIFLWRLKWSRFNEVEFLDCSVLRNIRKDNSFRFNLTYTFLVTLSFLLVSFFLVWGHIFFNIKIVRRVGLFIIAGLIEYRLVNVISNYFNNTTPNENKSKLTLPIKVNSG